MVTVTAARPKGVVARRFMPSGIIALMAAWFLFATGEALYGDLDGTTDFGAIADASGRFAAGALLELAAAVLLAVGAAALMMLLRDAAPRLSVIGGWVTLAGAVGVAGFAQFHLMLLAMSDAALDRTAMNAFLVGSLEEVGLWGIPVIFVLLAVPIGLLLLALGTARAGITSHVPAVLIGVYMVVHLVGIPGIAGDWTEVLSHYLLAGVLFWIGWRVFRSDPGSEGSEERPVADDSSHAGRRTAATTAAIAMVLFALPGVAFAAPSDSRAGWTYPLVCDTPEGDEVVIDLLVVGRMGWDAVDPSQRYLMRSATQDFLDDGGETFSTHSKTWGRYDPSTAWTCASGPIDVQGFQVSIVMDIVPLP
jgi:hypothetical protein